jgi:small nuclear ribonucleoprotein (snRNP)-like protein
MVDTPTTLVERLLSQRVTLLLKDSRQMVGTLLGVDEHMNLVLDDTDETTVDVSRHLGRVVLRGSNVVLLHAAQASGSKSK